MYQYILVCTRINWIMNMSWMYKYVYTSTYEYICVQSVLYAFKKKCKQVSNPWSSAYFSQNVPLHYGSTDLNAGYMLCCHQCIYSLPLPSVSTMSQQKCKMSHVGHATFGSSTTNTLHTAESLGYMLLARPICELSVLEQWRALANAMPQRGLCEMWVVQAECTATAHGS